MIGASDIIAIAKAVKDGAKYWMSKDVIEQPKSKPTKPDMSAIREANNIIRDYRDNPGGLKPAVPTNARDEIAYLIASGDRDEEVFLDILTGKMIILDNENEVVVIKGEIK